MTLAQAAATTTISPGVTNRILVLDVERLDGLSVQHWWDRGDLKSRYIHHETVLREPRTTVVCAKWYGEPNVMRFAEWDAGGRGRFLKRVHALVKEADLVVGHNCDNADVPWLWGDFYLARIGHKHRPNLPVIPEPKTYDTLKPLRRKFKSGMPFKGLDAALKILGHPGKTDHYDRDRMERAVAGDKQAQEETLDYCEGDVIGGEFVYDWTRPHSKNYHPTLIVAGQDKFKTCRSCGGETELLPGRRHIADVFSYALHRCPACGWHGSPRIEPTRVGGLRGV